MIAGYANNSRGAGVRSHQLILPSVVCSTHLAKKVADAVDAITFAHQHGCGIIGPDVAGVNEYFVALAGHPNIQSTLVLGLGCETLQGNEVTESIATKYPETKYVVIQESAGMAGALDSSIATARALRVEPKRQELPTLAIGIEGLPQSNIYNELISLLVADGHQVFAANAFKEPAKNFVELVRKKCHVIVSFPDENQPPVGIPLIPVITIPNAHSPLHQALANDFDCKQDATAAEIRGVILKVASGELTKSEVNKVGNILVPRMVRSV